MSNKQQCYLIFHSGGDVFQDHLSGMYLNVKPNQEGGELTFTGLVARRKALFTIEGFDDDSMETGLLYIYTDDVLAKTRLYLQPGAGDPEVSLEAVFEQTNKPKPLYYIFDSDNVETGYKTYRICVADRNKDKDVIQLSVAAPGDEGDLRMVQFSFSGNSWGIMPE